MQLRLDRLVGVLSVGFVGLLLAAAPAPAQSVSFAPAKSYSTGQLNPSGIVSANFLTVLKNDSIAVSASYATPGQPYYMAVFETSSKGTLGPPGLFPSGPGEPNTSNFADIAAGDFKSPNSMGADLAIANPATKSVTVQNNPFGFSPMSYPVGDEPAGVATPDLNGDGADDLLVANSGSADVSVLLNDGSGSFGTASSVSVGAAGSAPGEIGTGDFNGDGHADFAVALQNASAVAVLLGNGSGGFGSPTSIAVGAKPTGVAVGYIDGDKALDLAVPSSDYAEVAIVLGNGDGSFKAPSEVPTLPDPQAIVLDDLNGDGNADLALATLASQGSSNKMNLVSVMLGKGDGTFTSAADNQLEVGEGPVAIASGRLRGPEALPDLFTANFESNDVSALINQTATCRGKPATIVGSGGNDKLTGTMQADVIVAGRGDDKIQAKGGDDVVCAGGGRDTVTGGRGDDVLLGGRHSDLIRGQGGHDKIHGGAGGDTCRGGAGNNKLRRC